MAKSVKDIPVQATIQIDEKILNSIRQIRQKQSNIQLEVGALEAQKHIVLHRLHEEGEKLQSIMVELEKEHGKGSINLDTGELTLDSPDNGNS
jgi:threonyl-tRNA synthetase